MSENQNIEYKLSWHDDYLKWICGFANAQGGTLFIGIDDEGNHVNLDNASKLMEDIPNKIRNVMGIICRVNLNKKRDCQFISINVNPNVELKIDRFGSDSTDLKFHEIIEGNLIHILKEAQVQLNHKFLIRPIEFVGMHRIEKYEYAH
jgi:predicted HTH transcriptional regulator